MGSAEGSWYSPRLLLSLIFELSPDSRFMAAHRADPEDTAEWRAWGSRTFQNQILASISNWTQLHTIGGLNWDKGKQPEYSPLTDPSQDQAKKPKRPPSLEEIFFQLTSQG